MSTNLFGSEVLDRDLAKKIEALMGSPNAYERAIAENLVLDKRVPGSRAAAFVSTIADHDGLIESLVSCSRNAPLEFEDPDLNSGNLIGLSDQKEGLPSECAAIVRLFGDVQRFLFERLVERDPDLIDLVGVGDRELLVDEWLNQYENESQAPLELQQSLADVFHKVAEEQGGGTFPPQRINWVTDWELFSQYLSSDRRTWLEVLGLGAFLDSGLSISPIENWFMLLRYPVSSTTVLARPTVLDAGIYPWHFPTSSDEPAEKGGMTVVIDDAFDSARPLPEFIHPFRELEPSDIVRVFRFKSSKPLGCVESNRRRHRDWLANEGVWSNL